MTLDEAAVDYRAAQTAMHQAARTNSTAYHHHTHHNTTDTLRAWQQTIAAYRTAKNTLDHARDQLVTAALNHTCP